MGPSAHRRSPRTLAAAVVVSMLASACGQAVIDGAAADGGPGGPPESLPLVAAPQDRTSPSGDPDGRGGSVTEASTTTLAPDPYRTWIATARPEVTHLVAHESPDGPVMRLPFGVPNPHQFGGPLTLMVTEGQPGDEWLRVQLPIRPNGQEAWIRSENYELTSSRIRAEVNLSATMVTVFDGERVIAESAAVIGDERTPTPLGTFYIAAKRISAPEETFLGPVALVLSGFSEVHETFSGGLPVIAIHGTSRPDQVGQALSNGCIRVPNDVVEFLAENVPLGVPVHISA